MNLYKFLPWIDTNKLNMSIISSNEKSIHFLQENPDKIDWESISSNKNAVHLILQNIDKICWKTLCYNASDKVLPILHANIDKVYWHAICMNQITWINQLLENNLDRLSKDDLYHLCRNPAAIPTIEYLIKTDFCSIDWSGLSMNENALHLFDEYNKNLAYIGLHSNLNPNAIYFLQKYRKNSYTHDVAAYPTMIPFLKTHPEYIDHHICINEHPDALELIEIYIDKNLHQIEYVPWDSLSYNPVAIPIMKRYVEHINWYYFCRLEVKESIEIIEENLDKVDWDELSTNALAIHILEQNREKINWNNISMNDSIFTEIS
jgi:hypothetical protein